MKKLLIVLALVGLIMAPMPAFAANLEMLDEMTLGVKVQSQDIILKSEHIDLGAEIGSTDIHNADSTKDTFYAMGVVTIKGWSLFDWTK